MTHTVNIGLISTLRPDLLSRTLESFKTRALSSVRIGGVFVNLDNAFGDAADRDRCFDILHSHFDAPTIDFRETPGFGRAVRNVWSSMPDGPFLYLEDDWICLEDLPLDRMVDLLDDQVKMITFLTRQHGLKARRRYSLQMKRDPGFAGLPGRIRAALPAFNTSPALIDGAFARACAERFDTSLDPEKQMRKNINPELIGFQSAYTCRFWKSRFGLPVIRDIGRDWCDARGISKTVSESGQSDWAHAE